MTQTGIRRRDIPEAFSLLMAQELARATDADDDLEQDKSKRYRILGLYSMSNRPSYTLNDLVRAECASPRTDAAGLTGTTWPVTSQSNRRRGRQALLDRRRSVRRHLPLDPRFDVHRLHGRNRRHAYLAAPGQKVTGRA